MKRLLVTGSRSWTDRAKILAELDVARHEFGDDTVLVHGDARGVDRIAAHLWHCEWMLPAEDYPADWTGPCAPDCPTGHRKWGDWDRNYCPRAGYRRNAEMVALGPVLCLAFILDESLGATGCVRLARKAGIPVRIFRASSALSVPIGGER
jgi:hypothetical protein